LRKFTPARFVVVFVRFWFCVCVGTVVRAPGFEPSSAIDFMCVTRSDPHTEKTMA
jgi:hypothetical protein